MGKGQEIEGEEVEAGDGEAGKDAREAADGVSVPVKAAAVK